MGKLVFRNYRGWGIPTNFLISFIRSTSVTSSHSIIIILNKRKIDQFFHWFKRGINFGKPSRMFLETLTGDGLRDRSKRRRGTSGSTEPGVTNQNLPNLTRCEGYEKTWSPETHTTDETDLTYGGVSEGRSPLRGSRLIYVFLCLGKDTSEHSGGRRYLDRMWGP